MIFPLGKDARFCGKQLVKGFVGGCANFSADAERFRPKELHSILVKEARAAG